MMLSPQHQSVSGTVRVVGTRQRPPAAHAQHRPTSWMSFSSALEDHSSSSTRWKCFTGAWRRRLLKTSPLCSMVLRRTRAAQQNILVGESLCLRVGALLGSSFCHLLSESQKKNPPKILYSKKKNRERGEERAAQETERHYTGNASLGTK